VTAVAPSAKPRPTLGILIPYHGERELLRDLLESIAAQSVRPDEVLIYDDASDAPPEPYVPSGLEVTIIRGEVNRGPVYGRNHVLGLSTSRYVHFHDADDLLEPDWCARVHQALDESRVDVVFTEISCWHEDGWRSPPVLGLNRLVDGEDLVRFCLQGPVLPPAGTYAREVVLAIGGYRRELWQSEDFDFHVRLAAHGVTYAVITEPLVIVRIRQAGRHQQWLEVWNSFLQSVELLSGELPSRYRPDLADAAALAGSALFRMDARAEARRAFRLAKRLGPPSYRPQRRLYRTLARSLGPWVAEQLAGWYRHALPATFRGFLAQRGW
jgi:glycosyltransferase involved in cell wall biosynthesis